MDEKEIKENFNKYNDDNELICNFCNAIKAGNNKILHNKISEAITLDDGWINTIQNALFFVEDIVKNPKKFIKENLAVVNVALARKTDSRSIRYLATNTKDISQIKENGEIIPKNVLTSQMEEDIAIYENRFVCALVNRLIPFVEQRYQDIVGENNMYDITRINLDSSFDYGKTSFKYEIKLEAKEPPKDQILLEKNNKLIEVVKDIRRRLQVLKGTEFMKILDASKVVYPPINKTNLIKMNVNYNNCYKLWLYISSYSMVGFSVQVQDKNLPFDESYYNDLAFLGATNLVSMLNNDIIRKKTYDKISYSEKKEKKYKVLTKYNYSPSFGKDKKTISDNVVNEFYYNKIKNLIDKVSENFSSNDIVNKKEISMTFAKYFRAINNITDKMFFEMLEESIPKNKSLKRKTLLMKKKEECSKQKVLYNHLNQLSKLKGEEYSKSLRLLSRNYLMLDKLKLEYDELCKKDIRKKERKKTKINKINKIKQKPQNIVNKSKNYESEIFLKAEEKRLELLEKERERKERQKTEKELKLLSYLKEKYEGNNQ